MISLYLDEDLSDHQIVGALRLADFNVLTSRESNMDGQSDQAQLAKAVALGRAIVTANIRDFVPLHRDYILADQIHRGIVLVHQQRYSAGEILRRLVLLTSERRSIDSELHFLSNY